MSSPNLKPFLGTIDYIFVDLFDTLLFRETTPELQRFYHIAKRFHAHLVKVQGTKAPSLQDVFLARVSSWRTAYKTASLKEGCAETTFAEIIRLTCGALRLDPSFEKVWHDIELQYEVEATRPNKPLARKLQEAQQSGIKIYYVSDMYLSGSDLEVLLDRHLPDLRWDGGEVSSTSGLSKRHKGRLFCHLLDKLNIQPDRVLHIGDNYHSDYLMPLEIGLQALYAPRSIMWRCLARVRHTIFKKIMF